MAIQKRNEAGNKPEAPPLNSPNNGINICTSSVSIPKEQLLDHLELRIKFDCPGMRKLKANLLEKVTHSIAPFLHNPQHRKFAYGAINIGEGKSNGNTWLKFASTNGKRIYYAQQNMPYSTLSKPKRGASTSNHNQLTNHDKVSISKASNGTPWKWQLDMFTAQVDGVINAYLQQYKRDGIKLNPIKCRCIEFYKEYLFPENPEKYFDELTLKITQIFGASQVEIQSVKDKSKKYLAHGRYRSWKVKIPGQEEFTVKSYEKGKYLRVEFKFRNIACGDKTNPRNFAGLYAAGQQADGYFKQIDSLLVGNPLSIDVGELRQAMVHYFKKALTEDKYKALIEDVAFTGAYQSFKASLKLNQNDRSKLTKESHPIFVKGFDPQLCIAPFELPTTKRGVTLYLRKDWLSRSQAKEAEALNNQKLRKNKRTKKLQRVRVPSFNRIFDEVFYADYLCVGLEGCKNVLRPVLAYPISQNKGQAMAC